MSVRATPAKDAKGVVFPLTGLGPNGVAGNINIQANALGAGTFPPFEHLISGPGGPGWEIDAGDVPPKDTNSFWGVDHLNVTSDPPNSLVEGIHYTRGQGSIKGPFTVIFLPAGVKALVEFHFKNQQ